MGVYLKKPVECFEKDSLLFCPEIAQSTKEANSKWQLKSVEDSIRI